MHNTITFSRRLASLLASRKFFWVILVLFVLQAAWIALSGRYPMAFDEDFHLGIIRLYAHHISPFWFSQPENADRFGAVARDPSYLYQYLMSFPYRLINLFTHDQTIIVIILRFINIGLFAWGLTLFRRLLLKTGISRAVVHLSLLVFVLLPIVPLLAAQINYDNLLIPMVAVSLLFTVQFDAALAKKRLDIKILLTLLTVCLLACIVKYAFLPIFISIIGFIIVRIWQNYASINNLLASFNSSWRSVGLWSRVWLITGFIIAAGLFTQRFGVNIVRYHTPAPDCSKVLSIEQCHEYGPWIRDYNYKLIKVPGSRSPLTYTREWFYGMWLRTFFAVGGPETTFQTRGPLEMPGLGSIVFTVVGFLAFIVAIKRILKIYNTSVIWLILAVTSCYISFLWIDELQAYLRTGQPVAINGRYLLPVLPLLLLLIVASAARLTQKRPKLQLTMSLLLVICLAMGGGTLTFILRSNDAWYWNNASVRSANQGVQRVIGPITPGYSNPIQYLR